MITKKELTLKDMMQLSHDLEEIRKKSDMFEELGLLDEQEINTIKKMIK